MLNKNKTQEGWSVYKIYTILKKWQTCLKTFTIFLLLFDIKSNFFVSKKKSF